MTAPQEADNAEGVPVEMHLRDVASRLRYLGNYWSETDRLKQLGVMLSLRIMADEIERSDGSEEGK